MWPYPKILAHRGGGSLAPENTIAALRCGMAHGFRAVEFDVMLARDGVGVVMHDTCLGRTVAGAGQVADFTSVQLAAMDAGAWFGPQFVGEPVPLFTQFVRFCQDNGIWMNIEIKPAAGFEAVTGRIIATVTRTLFEAEIGAGQAARLPLLSSFSRVALAAAQAAAPDLARAFLVGRIPVGWEAHARALEAVSLNVNQRYLTRRLAQAVKQAGFGLFCYTVNQPERARELLEWGVDGLCTDRIDLIGPELA